MGEDRVSVASEAATGVDPEALAREGRELYRQGDFEAARVRLYEAYEAFKDAGDLNGVAETANDVGVLYTVQQHYAEAESWLLQAQSRFVDLQDYEGEAQTLGNLGSLCQARGDLQQAAAYLQQAADRFHLVGDDEKRSATLRVLSIVRLRQMRFLQALAAYEAALACHPRQNAFRRLLRRIFGLPRRLLEH
jgi:tetratricopeptide (TPR) repeat protein